MSDHFDHIIRQLQACGVGFEPGLSDAEVERVPYRFGFVFPPDLREFLQRAVPISEPERAGVTWKVPFPNWRDEAEEPLRERLSLPLEGILFDVERDNFWRKDWGERPANLQDALAVAREAVRAAPVLIPVYGHRFVPALPCEAGNPIFSVHQTDIIFYGYDLPGYFAHAFKIENPCPKPEEPRHIEFWSWFTDRYTDWPEEPPLTLEPAEAKIEACRRSVEVWRLQLQKEEASPSPHERRLRSLQRLLSSGEQDLHEWEQKRRDLLSGSTDATST